MSSQWPPTEPPNEHGEGPSDQHRYGPPGYGQQPASYPQQHLLPQEIKPGRNRKPLFIGIAVALVLIVGGLVTWRLLDQGGEDTRAQYCAVLKELAGDGDLTSVIGSADEATLDQVTLAYELAPDAVEGQWATLKSVAESLQSGSAGSFDVSVFIDAYGAFQGIARDAESNCGLTIEIPGLN